MSGRFRILSPVVALFAVAVLAIATCSGCNSRKAAPGGVSRPNIPTAAQQDQAIQGIESNPTIPAAAKASAIAEFKQQVQRDEAEYPPAAVKTTQ